MGARWLVWVPILAGCGGTVVIDGSGGASSTTSASVAATGASTSGGFTTASSSTGMTSPACADAFIDVDAGDGPLHLVASCPNEWGANESARPVAYFSSGLALTGNLTVSGCLDGSPGAPHVQAIGFGIDDASASSSPGIVMQFIDSSYQVWSATQKTGQLTVTKMSKVGGVVEGTFVGDVTNGGQVKTVKGTFRACRVDNLAVP